MTIDKDNPFSDAEPREDIEFNLRLVWYTCGKMLQSAGLIIDEPENISYEAAEIACNLIEKILEDNSIRHHRFVKYELTNLIKCIGAASDILRGVVTPKSGVDHTSSLLQLGFQIGYVYRLHSLFQYNDRFLNILENSAKFDRIRQAPKKRLASWVQAFAPVARAYCAQRSKVSYGQLRRCAREWAAASHVAGRDWILPQDDKSITSGIKKLEKLGMLVIPGRQGREA